MDQWDQLRLMLRLWDLSDLLGLSDQLDRYVQLGQLRLMLRQSDQLGLLDQSGL